jgi:lysophospholipase L1-like esterase
MRTILLLMFACFFSIAARADDIPNPADILPIFQPNSRILFQGDSITDGNRGRTADPNHILGHGYQFIISAKYGADLADRHLTFLNRGISGNTVADLAKRWQTDTLDLKPDVLSILIGVNDLGRNVPMETYRQQYDQLLADTLKALPNVRLVLCEPFGLPVGKHKDDWPKYHIELTKRQQVVAGLAIKYHAAIVHFQKVFDDACRRAPGDYWIWDGVHPTYSGHQLMADEWVRVVQKIPATAPPFTPPVASGVDNSDQDGPGQYRVSSGVNGHFSAIIRASSREDAINKALLTVGKKAADYDENVELHTLKVEKIGP